MPRRIERSLALGVAIELTMVLGFGALLLAPRWKLAPMTPTADAGVSHFPVDWSPDGAALLTSTRGGFDVLGFDGSVLMGVESGASPVWIDQRTILLLEPVDETTDRLVRLDTGDGRRETIGAPLTKGHLIADGRGRVAHQTVMGPRTITVLDPTDGHALAELAGHRATTWTSDGALIVKRPETSVERYSVDPGWLFLWRPGAEPRPIGAGLVDMGNVSPLSPAGDAITCICTAVPFPPDPPPDGPARAIYRLPTDGSAPTTLAPWPTRGGAEPEIAWIDDTSLAVVGGEGLSRVSASGGLRPIPGLSAVDLGFQTMYGRVFQIRGETVAVLQDLVGGTDALLVVVDDQDRIRLRRSFSGSLPDLTIDAAGQRGVVLTEFTIPGEPSFWDLYTLEFR
jgi:hypothetical protein